MSAIIGKTSHCGLVVCASSFAAARIPRMPVHSVVITNSAGIVLFHKYYDQDVLSTSDGRLFFEGYLFRHTKGYWGRSYSKQTASFLSVIQTLDIHCDLIVDRNVHVMLQSFGDLIIFITGKDDVDELICKSLLLAPHLSHEPVSFQ
jgi:hypothetical protein